MRLPVVIQTILLLLQFRPLTVFNLSWLLNGRDLSDLLDRRSDPK